MGCLILNFFLLILYIFSNLAPDIMHQEHYLSNTIFQKDFKLISSWKNSVITLNSGFVLLLIKKNFIFQEMNCKLYSSLVFNFYIIKFIFALSEKVITRYMQSIIIEIRVSSLKKPLQNIFSKLLEYWRKRIPMVFHKFFY